MTGVNDIAAGLRTPTQVPLDAKGYFVSQDAARNLGADNNLAFTYEKGLRIYCALEETRWEWRQPRFLGEVGLRPTLFTYPNNYFVNGINYSNKQFNFFPFFQEATIPIQQLINTLSLDFSWKRGERFVTKNLEDLPLGVTDNIYTRNGYVSDKLPIAVGGELVYDLESTFIEFQIQNLAIHLKEFATIQNYQPTLIISRHLPSKIKKEDLLPPEEGTVKRFKRAGFKIPILEDNVRLQKIPLNKKYQVIDFGQEHFFKSFDDIYQSNTYNKLPLLQTRGAGKKYSNIRFISENPPLGDPITQVDRGNEQTTHKAFVYLQFHIQVRVNNAFYISKALGKLKMEAFFSPFGDRKLLPGETLALLDFPNPQKVPRIRFKHT